MEDPLDNTAAATLAPQTGTPEPAPLRAPNQRGSDATPPGPDVYLDVVKALLPCWLEMSGAMPWLEVHAAPRGNATGPAWDSPRFPYRSVC